MAAPSAKPWTETYDEGVRKHVLSAIERICRAEAMASGAEKPPEFTTLSSYPLTVNDAACSERVAKAFQAQFGERAFETPPASASEDFSVFGSMALQPSAMIA